MPVTFIDTTSNTRTEASDLIRSVGYRSNKVAVDLSYLEAEDRTKMASLIQTNGLSKSIFVSVFPEDSDVIKEYMYQIYGKLPSINSITHPNHILYSPQLELEEV